MAEQKPAPIIKKIKKGGHGGHHGGAWKVAYADFVTAMMAFFLLMWLLNATSKEQKMGISDYFTPIEGIRGAMGIGFKGGETQAKTGIQKSDAAAIGVVKGAPTSGISDNDEQTPATVDAEKENALFKKAEDDIKKALEEDANLRDMQESIVIEQSPEGLKIEVLDLDKSPMFEPGTAQLTPNGRKVLSKMSLIVQKMPNFISISGHTDSTAFSPTPNYTNWELSSDRAQASRRFLVTTNMEPERVAKVVGLADRDPLDKNDFKSVRNRRISIILLRGAYMESPDSFMPAPRDLLSLPKGNDAKKVPSPVAAPPAQPASTLPPPDEKKLDNISPQAAPPPLIPKATGGRKTPLSLAPSLPEADEQ